jgi:very-short-patch-repair endonuclease
MDRPKRRRIAHELAELHDGVVSRAELRSAGVTDADIRAELRAERWAVHGNQTIAIHTRPLSERERRWRTIWEIGERVACLDGVTALQEAGLTGFDEDTVHISVVHSHTVKRLGGVRVHKITRRFPGEVMRVSVPRTQARVAAIRAAHWAVSNRQAALILIMSTQQGLCTPDQLLQTSKHVRGRRRRAFVRGVIRDLALGVRSLGELDFAKLCRARGLPEPVRQQVRQGAKGRAYLDVRWACGLVVEIDGVQHFKGLAPVDDQLRQNRVALTNDTVLRIPNIGLRLHEDEFMEQVAAGLRQRGAIAV